MNSITTFQEIRRDGKVIEESMTPEDMIRAGWQPDKVVALRWVWYDRTIELRSPFGFLSRVVPSREYVAVLEDTDAGGQHAVLTVYQTDGSPRGTFRNVLEIAGKPAAGEFRSFRTPKSPLPTAFCVLFDVFSNGGTYQVDIDAASGAVLGMQEVH
jgi:hypothetical protein